MDQYHHELDSGSLGLIVLEGFSETGKKVDQWIKKIRGEENSDVSYIVPMKESRFANGEGKVKLLDTVRGKDVYIFCDVGNYSCEYTMFGYTTHKGPDEHFQDIKRAISAIAGKANRVTVIMPLLYAARQHRKKGRESLDCAVALQELMRLGVDTLITFDAHDPNIQNAIPLCSFENVMPTYSIMKHFIQTETDLRLHKDNMLVISPDTGAMERAIFYSNVLGLDVGMFYKRRDHSRLVNGKNPIVQHEYVGTSLEGKDILVVDDMIASGESLFDVIREAKKRGVNRIYVASTFAFFTEGIAKFDQYYRDGLLDKVYSTNLSYVPPAVREAPWFEEVDLSKYIAKVVNALNLNESLSSVLNPTEKIRQLLDSQNL